MSKLTKRANYYGRTDPYYRKASLLKNSINTYFACSSDSRTKIPAPSPITKPSLASSNGREAFSGVSLYTVDRALKLLRSLTKENLSSNEIYFCKNNIENNETLNP